MSDARPDGDKLRRPRVPRVPDGSATGPVYEDDPNFEAILLARLESGQFIRMDDAQWRRLQEEIAAGPERARSHASSRQPNPNDGAAGEGTVR